ncbi:MAG TPA: 50S ribosomal protein L15 [Patescibacteria group bacterium]|nr:50S ribosomal protein L15 [Patescibacteria group bacterium]
MIYLHQLPQIVARSKKRVGRGLGSGVGAKSGRGTTRHQRAREKIPLSFEGGQNRLVKKFPLLRGKAKNAGFRQKPFMVNIGALENIGQDEEITAKTLIKYHIVTSQDARLGLKIGGHGIIKKPLTVILPITHSASEKIKKAGGKIIQL